MDVDVAVVGRGLIGSAAARHLAEGGQRVALIGAGEPDDAQTWDGPFASHYDEGRVTRIIDRKPVWATLAARSIDRYADIARRSGVDIHDPCGLVYNAPDPEAALEIAERLGADAAMATADEIFARYGIRLPERVDRAVIEGPPAGRINPRACVAAQTRLVELAGGAVVNAVARSLERSEGAISIRTDETTVAASRVLLATGAWGAELAGIDLPLEPRMRTIVLAELSEGPALPTLIVNEPQHAELGDMYWVPPVPFPEGRTLLKIGGDSVPQKIAGSPDELTAWFRAGGDEHEAAVLLEELFATLPDRTITWSAHKPCVVTYTATGLPHIGWIDDGIAVAVGGCGAAAKSADEIGRLASTLFSEQGWHDDELAAADFAPPT